MRHAFFSLIATAVAVLVFASLPAAAATFQVADEEDGPVCWLDFDLSGNRTLAIFTAKGQGGKSVEILLQDRQDSGSLSKVPETFEVTFQFADGTRQSYRGSISEYFGEPYAEAKLGLVKRLSDGKGFKLTVSGIGGIPVKDTLSEKTYGKFVACMSR